jgi:antitoxin component YwqK of YwqJK toxin-antitoxin module
MEVKDKIKRSIVEYYELDYKKEGQFNERKPLKVTKRKYYINGREHGRSIIYCDCCEEKIYINDNINGDTKDYYEFRCSCCCPTCGQMR